MPKILSFDRKNFLSFDSLLELYNSWLNQPLLTNSSPTFENLEVSNEITINGVPVVSSQWEQDGADIYYNAGNVGIGTTTPTAKLQVVSGDVQIVQPTIGNSSGLYIYGSDPFDFRDFSIVSNNTSTVFKTHFDKPIHFLTNNNSRLTINDDGNIGIGTSNPIVKLDVVGSTNISGNVGIGTNDPGSYKLNVEGNALIKEALEMTPSGSGSSAFSLTPLASGYANSAMYINTPNTASSSSFNFIDARAQGVYKFVVRGDGNVGINTASPQYTLDVRNTPSCDVSFKSGWSDQDINLYFGTHVTNGVSKSLIVAEGLNSAGRSKFHFCLNNNADDFTGQASLSDSRMVITYDGQVGIGTTTPTYELDVIGDINFTGDLYQDGVLFSGGSSQWTTTGSDIYYTTGNVGIGTNAPAYKLDVIGDINFTGILYQNGIPFSGSSQWNNDTNGIYYPSSGSFNVGIGTNSQTSYKLHVDGDINFTQQLRKNGTELVLVDVPLSITISAITNFTGSTFNISNEKYFKLENVSASKVFTMNVRIPASNITSGSSTTEFEFDIPNATAFTNTYDATFTINGYTTDGSDNVLVNIENCIGYCKKTEAKGICSFTSSITTDIHVLQITVYY